MDDIAILLMFSGFERTVRDRLASSVEAAASKTRNDALRSAAAEFIRFVSGDPFAKVLKTIKVIDTTLLKDIKKIQDYRHWVAHGRGGDTRETVTPVESYERMILFLDQLGQGFGQTS